MIQSYEDPPPRQNVDSVHSSEFESCPTLEDNMREENRNRVHFLMKCLKLLFSDRIEQAINIDKIKATDTVQAKQDQIKKLISKKKM